MNVKTKRKMASLEKRVRIAGGQKNDELQAAMNVADQGVAVIQREKDVRKEKYQAGLENWGELPKPGAEPTQLPDQTRLAQRYRRGGYVSIFFEVFVAVLVGYAARGFLGAAVAAAAAALLALLLHYGMDYLFNRHDRPQESIERLRSFIGWPSFVIALLSAFMLLLPRVMHGTLLLMIRPYLNIALYTAGVGLLFLGASLLVVAGIYFWSKDSTDEYKALEDEETAWVELKRRFEVELKKRQPFPPPPVFGQQVLWGQLSPNAPPAPQPPNGAAPVVNVP